MSWGLLSVFRGPFFLTKDLPYLPDSKIYLFFPFSRLGHWNAPYSQGHFTTTVSRAAADRPGAVISPVYSDVLQATAVA